MAVVPFRAPARRRHHEGVAERLRDAILDGRFAPGTKLPPERELALEFDVHHLRARGLVNAHRHDVRSSSKRGGAEV